MADSACLMHGFSYASAIPNHSKQGSPMHALGESISFGRFMNEPLSWDKWSAFSHKKYVEEAARFAQPGSVAAKKAFFEAHYKRIAAQKAAAEAEALLEQESEQPVLDTLNSEFDEQNDSKRSSAAVVTGNEGKGGRIAVNFSDSVSCSEGSGTPQMERPLLKNSDASEDTSSATSKKKSGLSSLKSSIRRKTWKVPSTPLKPVTPPQLKNVTQSTRKSTVDFIDKKRSSPKSLHGLIKLIPIKAPDKEPITKDTSSRTPKACKTPMRTPIVAATNGAVKYPASTPKSENTRMKTPIDSSTTGSKTSGPKWHILSSVYSKSLTACRNKLQSPTSSTTPFLLRTEERAAKRKQKLEEKFNANESNKAQLQKTLKEKAGNEIRKLSCGFCFKARPLPDFYKERETSINQTKKTQAAQLQTTVLGRSISNKKQGAASTPPPPPPPKPSGKINGSISNKTPVLGRSISNKKQGATSTPPPPPPPKPSGKISGVPKTPSRKNAAKSKSKIFTTTLPQRITHENKSPNIQH